MKHSGWWISNLWLAIIFIGVSGWIWLRGVDGAGIVQTPKMKLMALLIWAIFVAMIVVIEWIVWLVR
ncbi:DUF3923 family protein [Lentilactobacillus kisonensis]|nr:DUF3923 family protein [Lentilactobacillus kisonensis]